MYLFCPCSNSAATEVWYSRERQKGVNVQRMPREKRILRTWKTDGGEWSYEEVVVGKSMPGRVEADRRGERSREDCNPVPRTSPIDITSLSHACLIEQMERVSQSVSTTTLCM